MINTKFDWTFREHQENKAFQKDAKKEGLDALAAGILYARGIHTKDALEDFLKPSLDKLHDPFLLHDMDKAVERIRRAIEQGEQILVYGDYDADGMTAAAIMKETLEELGAEVLVYLPNRFTDGYGPNQSVYKYFIEQMQVSLIITVDNGVAGHEAIAYAQESGVDVVVTDHHALPDQLPNAYAIVHPEHPDSVYPFPYLAGCGVAFKVACALLESVQTELLDLVAIGTIADMVSLIDENRILVQVGLSVLRQTGRLGLEELCSQAGLELSQMDEESIGFQIAPRLNALGRLDDPNPAIELLTGFDEEEAQEIAQMIDAKNEERKALVDQITKEAKAMVQPDQVVQVLAKEGWNPGVLGIVAGRLLEELHQPVVVLSITDQTAKGSARSVPAVHLFDALKDHRELFLAFGGHAGAAGMTLEVDRLDDLRQVLTDDIQQHHLDLSQKAPLVIEDELVLDQISLDTVQSLQRLAPFGMENPKPVFVLKDFQVESVRTMGKDQEHLKMRIQKGGERVDVLAFFQGNLAESYRQVKGLELAVTLSVNVWNGVTSLQLMLVDARVEGVQLYDLRSKTAQLPEGLPVWQGEEVWPHSVLVLDQLPDDLTGLKRLFREQDFVAIYFKNRLQTPYYLEGFGSREQYARLYKTIYQFPEFDVRYKLKELSQYLNLSQPLLIKMIQIFEELGFVSITDGVMRVQKDAAKREIEDSQIYQDLKQEVKEQEILALGTVQEIYDFLKS